MWIFYTFKQWCKFSVSAASAFVIVICNKTKDKYTEQSTE